jgi:hypothetical protein
MIISNIHISSIYVCLSIQVIGSIHYINYDWALYTKFQMLELEGASLISWKGTIVSAMFATYHDVVK